MGTEGGGWKLEVGGWKVEGEKKKRRSASF